MGQDFTVSYLVHVDLLSTILSFLEMRPKIKAYSQIQTPICSGQTECSHSLMARHSLNRIYKRLTAFRLDIPKSKQSAFDCHL